MSAYSRDFDETKYISFEINNWELYENTKKLGKKLKIVSKKKKKSNWNSIQQKTSKS